MKFLVALNLLQTACLIVLVFLLLGRDDTASAVTPAAAVSDTRNAQAFGLTTSSQPASIDENRLRRIMREELAALDHEPGGYAARDIAASQRSPEENRYQREYVSQQIDYYASIGSIEEEEMQELQREIAELDSAGRKEMLSKLTRAMNARQIKGQL